MPPNKKKQVHEERTLDKTARVTRATHQIEILLVLMKNAFYQLENLAKLVEDVRKETAAERKKPPQDEDTTES